MSDAGIFVSKTEILMEDPWKGIETLLVLSCQRIMLFLWGVSYKCFCISTVDMSCETDRWFYVMILKISSSTN